MKKALTFLISVLPLLASCIQNDLPLPVVEGEFVRLEVEGAEDVRIDGANHTVSILLEETVNPSEVKILSASYGSPVTVSEPEIVGVQDLSAPLEVNLRTYQDYSWTITARREIERWFAVEGQIGAATIDEVNHRVVASVSSSADLSEISVSRLKLGPEGKTAYLPEIADIHDFTEGAEIRVSYEGHAEVWMLYLEPTDLAVQLDLLTPWTRCAWLSANGVSDRVNGFRWRREGDEQWSETFDVISDGGYFTACADSLEPDTRYECVAVSGEDVSEPGFFVTEGEMQLPNSGFEVFSNAESGVYSSWFDPASPDPALRTKWWDTGNVGSTTVGSAYCIAMPDVSDFWEGSACALLVSRNVIIKFAAGNTFSGEFAGLVGTQGGIINFGRPWSLRPRALRFRMKYTSGPIDVIDGCPEGVSIAAGDPDICSAWVALGDWDYRRYGGTADCPVQINTTDRNTFFNPEGESVIAYGIYETSASTDGWVEVVLPLEYRDVNRRPTHIIVSFASSKYGDYFTGSSQSRMSIDSLELIY